MRYLLILGFSVLLVLAVNAQSEVYELVVPSVDDYLDTLIANGPQFVTEDSSLHDSEFYLTPFISTISEVIFHLYPDARDIDYEKQLQTYKALDIGNAGDDQRDVWVQRMVEAWLYQNGVDLSAVNELQFDDFYIKVTPRDFSGDGENEYLLDLMKGTRVNRTQCVGEAEVVDYLVVQQTDAGYRFVETGLPWKGYPTYGRYSASEGGIIEFLFDDINADGLPEWVVLDGGNTAGGPGMGYVDYGFLYILGWRGDGLRFLSPNYLTDRYGDIEDLSFESLETLCGNGPYPLTVDWQFTDVDDDAPLEILQVQSSIDNWNCQRIKTRTFDWDDAADQYLYAGTQEEFAESTQDCLQRDAEERIWTGDYAAAIPLYERAVTAERGIYFETEYWGDHTHELNQYLRARLALAYMMTGQTERAVPLLNDLANEEIKDESIHQFVGTLLQAAHEKADPLQICIAVYNLFTESFPGIGLGYTHDRNGLDFYAPFYRPERAGCDAPTLVQNELTLLTIPIDRDPGDILNGLGIDVTRAIETDLDDDGLSEWFIWLNVPGMELFFAPDGGNYHLSFPTIDPYQRGTDIQIWPLPRDAGSAIALVTFDYFDVNAEHNPPWHCVYDPYCGAGGTQMVCPSDEGHADTADTTRTRYDPGALRMWRLENTELVPILDMPTCEKEIAVFPGVEGLELLHVTLINQDNYGPNVPPDEESFGWDATERQYIFQAESTASETPTQYPTPEPESQSAPYYSVRDAFQNGDFEAVLEMTRSVFSLSEDDNRDVVLENDYLRALALEAVGRNDDALNLYIAIYNAAPDHIWGILAALHFRPVN